MMKILICYLIIANVYGLAVMKFDKSAAKRTGARRTPERTLWQIAILGGATGTTIGMHIFRHKTKKVQFKYGLPFIAALQTIGVLYFIN